MYCIQNVFKKQENLILIHQRFTSFRWWLYRALTQRCSVKKVFLEISENSQDNTCARVSFLIKLQTSGMTSLTLNPKLCNFITSWNLIKMPQNFVQGSLSLKSTKIWYRIRGKVLVSRPIQEHIWAPPVAKSLHSIKAHLLQSIKVKLKLLHERFSDFQTKKMIPPSDSYKWNTVGFYRICDQSSSRIFNKLVITFLPTNVASLLIINQNNTQTKLLIIANLH